MSNSYVNKFDQLGESAHVGRKAEDLFEEWLKAKQRDYRPATTEEQYQHIDFVIHSKKLKRDVNIDVKGAKRRNRMDNSSNSRYIWVEFKNVRGDNGWLYGKADYIAFHNDDENVFCVVDRKDLVSLCERVCDDSFVKYPTEALYHKYTREGRKDVLSMLYFDDILSCRHVIIKI